MGCFSLFACLFLLILFPLVGCFVDLLPQTLLVGTFPYTFLVQSFLAPSSTGGGLFVDARTHTYHTVFFSKDGGIFLGMKVLHGFRITGFSILEWKKIEYLKNGGSNEPRKNPALLSVVLVV